MIVGVHCCLDLTRICISCALDQRVLHVDLLAMKRLDRLQGILIALQSRTVVRAEDLAQQYGVSVRTIYRDIRSLEESGIPLAAEAGVGYSLVQGYTLPPVHLTGEEAEHLLLAEKLLSATADHTTQRLVSSALHKIRAVLKTDDKSSVEYLEHRLIVKPTSHGLPIGPNVLSTIIDALRTSTRVDITYFSNSSQRTSQRIIEPVGIIFYAQHWHVLAWCCHRSAYRDFRVDRIGNAHRTDERFSPARHPMSSELAGRFHVDEHPEPMDIIIDVHESTIPHMTDMKRMFGFVDEGATHNGWRLMTFRPDFPDYFLCFLLGHGTAIRVVEPEAFRERMAVRALEIADHHSSGVPIPS